MRRVLLPHVISDDPAPAGGVMRDYAGRSGDVFFQTKPYWIDFPHGTNHGSPYSYDTHVPLLWFGVGVPVGTHPERVGVDDLAPTLSRLLHLPVPPQSESRALF